MGKSRNIKHLHSLFKDKTKIIKAKFTFSITNHPSSAVQLAVLRATTRSARSPPHDHLISALISFSHTTRHSAFACLSTIIHRLHHHHQPNVYVTLKSLIILHRMIISGSFGSFTLDEQKMLTARFGFLNLAGFIDPTDAQTREFSVWAQWYANFLEHNLSTSAILDSPLSLAKSKENIKSTKLFLYMDLFKELESLVLTVETISRAPKSLHCKKNDIVYEVIRLVGEDYRMVQYHTTIRLTELSDRVHKLTTHELTELTRCLERLGRCKGRLTELFVNRRRNESFWDSVTELKARLVRLRERKEMESVSWKMVVNSVK